MNRADRPGELRNAALVESMAHVSWSRALRAAEAIKRPDAWTKPGGGNFKHLEETMKIIGPDELIFGVDDVSTCRTFLIDFGLTESESGTFEALDGTCVMVREASDPSLPAPLATQSKLRKTVWGVADEATLDEIEAELRKDREVVRESDGSLSTRDDMDFAIGFRVTRRRPFAMEAEMINTPGVKPGRANNKFGANEDAEARPITLSHVVYFVPDLEKMERFYVDRLKFVEVDRFRNMGPFLRPRSNDDHHVLFMIQTPDYMQGLEHFAFHMQGPTALMLAGSRFQKKGYETFWGPGRHKFGSNWFWYFKSPMGVAIEYDADMDKLDDEWVARELPAGPEHAQIFLLKNIEKWAPGGPPQPGV